MGLLSGLFGGKKPKRAKESATERRLREDGRFYAEQGRSLVDANQADHYQDMARTMRSQSLASASAQGAASGLALADGATPMAVRQSALATARQRGSLLGEADTQSRSTLTRGLSAASGAAINSGAAATNAAKGNSGQHYASLGHAEREADRNMIKLNSLAVLGGAAAGFGVDRLMAKSATPAPVYEASDLGTTHQPYRRTTGLQR